MTVLKMEDKVQYKRHILTSGTITVESLHPMHIQLSAFFHSFLSHLHTYTYFKVALRQQNEHYIWHYEAFLVELPKALSVEKKSITRQCLLLGDSLDCLTGLFFCFPCSGVRKNHGKRSKKSGLERRTRFTLLLAVTALRTARPTRR